MTEKKLYYTYRNIVRVWALGRRKERLVIWLFFHTHILVVRRIFVCVIKGMINVCLQQTLWKLNCRNVTTYVVIKFSTYGMHSCMRRKYNNARIMFNKSNYLFQLLTRHVIASRVKLKFFFSSFSIIVKNVKNNNVIKTPV